VNEPMSEKIYRRLQIGLMITGVITAGSGWIFAAAIRSTQIDQNTRDISEIKANQRSDHDMLVEMKTHIEWIRSHLERKDEPCSP